MSVHALGHATFVFERRCAAPVGRVFAALSDPVERASWGAPSDNASLVYDQADFREGGQDIFRCGDIANPQYRGVTSYLDIVPNARIVSSEVIESGGQKLLISLSTTTLEPDAGSTKVVVTTQLTSLIGNRMIDGAKFGHNASLDNLVHAMALLAAGDAKASDGRPGPIARAIRGSRAARPRAVRLNHDERG
jgi:uncharacterized protein YndB with AHSA1/START domain